MALDGVNIAAQTNAVNYTFSAKKTRDLERVSAWDEQSTDTKAASDNSKEAATIDHGSARSYKTDAQVVAQLKADAEQRTESLRNLVQNMICKQTGIYGDASGDNMWQILREGKFSVDAETKAQAQKDISEDGYWGVEQTSDRIVKYAMALSGGDPAKLDSMIAAFEKGYAEAEKTWGGKLPALAQQTRDAVHEKFNKIKQEYGMTDK